jgi:uncharacterized membrane protein YbhN (UPF0104 family)
MKIIVTVAVLRAVLLAAALFYTHKTEPLSWEFGAFLGLLAIIVVAVAAASDAWDFWRERAARRSP